MLQKEVIRTASSHLTKGKEFNKPINIREIIFGFQDNSIAVLSIISGLIGGHLMQVNIVLAAIAAAIAGGIAVGIGGYVSSKSESDYFKNKMEEERQEIKDSSDVEREEIRQIFMEKAPFTKSEINLILNRITGNRKAWLNDMMRDEYGLFKEKLTNPLKIASVMLATEIAGGLIPVIPIIFLDINAGFITSIVITYAMLFGIGLWTSSFTKKNKLVSGLELVAAGILATIIPYLIGALITSGLAP